MLEKYSEGNYYTKLEYSLVTYKENCTLLKYKIEK